MKLKREQEVKLQEILDTLTCLKEMIAELGPVNGHFRRAIQYLDAIARSLHNWRSI